MGVRLITAKNVKLGFVNTEPAEFVDPDAYDTWMTRGIPRRGDVLFTTEAPLGNVAQLETDGQVMIGQRLITLRADASRLVPDFLKYALLSPHCRTEIFSRATGATVQGIKASLLKNVPIPLPPLDEQKRIVAVLDEAFEGLGRARANAEANLADARELFGVLTAGAFERDASDLREASLGELAIFRNGLNFTRSSKGQSIKIVGVGDFQRNQRVPVDALSEAMIDGPLSDDDCLRTGDILAVRSNGNKALIGRVMMVPETNETISFSGFTIRIRLVSAAVLPNYLLQFMRTPFIRETLTSGGGGSNISNLNQGQLSRLRIKFPSIDQQRNILDQISTINKAAEILQLQLKKRSDDLTSLRQSLLQKAFSGELT